MKPKQTAAYLLRRIEVYKQRYNKVVESRRETVKKVTKYKTQLLSLLTDKIRELDVATRELDRARTALASNSMTIQELNDQVAVQWKQNAEAKSDVERATLLASNAVQKHNKMVHWLAEARKEKDEADVQVELMVGDIKKIQAELNEAKRSLSNRIWWAILGIHYRTKLSWKWRVERWKNTWKIRRLNRARVTALSEAGHIPGNLVRMAHAYWEHDKQRMERGVTVFLDNAPGQKTVKENLWRRFRIWCGRA